MARSLLFESARAQDTGPPACPVRVIQTARARRPRAPGVPSASQERDLRARITELLSREPSTAEFPSALLGWCVRV